MNMTLQTFIEKITSTDMIFGILIINILFLVVAIATGSKKNIESRTEKEEKILRDKES
jgi:hypothetical protein